MRFVHFQFSFTVSTSVGVTALSRVYNSTLQPPGAAGAVGQVVGAAVVTEEPFVFSGVPVDIR